MFVPEGRLFPQESRRCPICGSAIVAKTEASRYGDFSVVQAWQCQDTPLHAGWITSEYDSEGTETRFYMSSGPASPEYDRCRIAWIGALCVVLLGVATAASVLVSILWK